MKRRKIFGLEKSSPLFSAFSLAAALSFALGASTVSQAQTQMKTLSFRIPGEAETLDWNRAHTAIASFILTNIMDGLVAYDANMKVVPALAERWTVSPNQTTYVFKLRPKVKWSDGVPLKAQDFVDGWRRLLSPVTGATNAYLLFDIDGAERFHKGELQDFSQVGIKAVNDEMLMVNLRKPVPYWINILTNFATFPIRQDIINKHGETGWETPGRIATLGPFLLSSHDMDSKFVLNANPSYYGTHGNIQQVIARIIKDDEQALKAYEQRQIDVLFGSLTLDLRNSPARSDLKRLPSYRTDYIGFSVKRYPTSNVKLRRAIAMAIDKSKLGALFGTQDLPATSFIPPMMMGHSKDIGLKFDPKRAKAELRESGIDLSRPISIDLFFRDWTLHQIMAKFIKEELSKNLGINVALSPFDNKSMSLQSSLKNYHVFETAWGAEYPDPDTFMSKYVSFSGNNEANWANPTYDKLVSDAKSLKDTNERQKSYNRAQKLLLEDDAVLVPLRYPKTMAFIRPYVKGLSLNPLYFFSLKETRIEDHHD